MTTILLHLHGLPAPIRLCGGSGAIAHAVSVLLKGWPSRIETRMVWNGKAFLSVTKTGDEFLLHRHDDGWQSVEPDDFCAVCTAIVEIVDGYVANGTGLGLLHAGSAEFAGRLVLFPASTLAGKSTLMTRLSAGGRKVFSDDLIPLDLASGEAVATGCLPRPRMPLPASVTPAFSAFVDRHAVARDDYYAYVDPGPELRAVFGERRPIGAVVLLSREQACTEARIEPATVDEALWALVSQDTRQDRVPEDMLEDYLRMVRGVRCCRLRYSDLEDAVRCLDAAFSDWPAAASPPPAAPEREHRMPDTAELASFADDDGIRYERSEQATLRLVGESGFVIDRETGAIYNLNAMGLAIWRLLDGTMTEEGIVAIFREAFPETPRETISRDVRTVISGLCDAGLALRADTPQEPTSVVTEISSEACAQES